MRSQTLQHFSVQRNHLFLLELGALIGNSPPHDFCHIYLSSDFYAMEHLAALGQNIYCSMTKPASKMTSPSMGDVSIAGQSIPHPAKCTWKSPSSGGLSKTQLAIAGWKNKQSWSPYLTTYSRIYEHAKNISHGDDNYSSLVRGLN